MARQPKLRKKTVGGSVYWFTKTGGDTYFGRVDEVSRKAANIAFAAHLNRVRSEETDSKRVGLTVGDLIDHFLEWVQKHRSTASYEARRLYCERFARFRPGTSKTPLADLLATRVRAQSRTPPARSRKPDPRPGRRRTVAASARARPR